MADRCVFFHDLLELSNARQKAYVVVEPVGTRLACLDASVRRGGDWYFGRRWIPTAAGVRELYRAIDHVEARGFRFRVEAAASRRLPHAPTSGREAQLRASELWADLSAEERDLHRELFPEEARLLALGYDWDARSVTLRGEPLHPDPYGRLLERDGDVLYEWVPVPEEHTWRRYPLGRLRLRLTAPPR